MMVEEQKDASIHPSIHHWINICWVSNFLLNNGDTIVIKIDKKYICPYEIYILVGEIDTKINK